MNSLFDGIAPLLPDLRAAGVRLAVATHALAQLQSLPEPVLMGGDRCHQVEGAAAGALGV